MLIFTDRSRLDSSLRGVTDTFSPGDAINRLRDDVAELADFPTWLPHSLGYLTSAQEGDMLVNLGQQHPIASLDQAVDIVFAALREARERYGGNT